MDAVTARMIPAGARIDEVYWALPTSYGSGDRFDTEELALAEGIARKRAEREENPSSLAPEGFSLDLRWKLSWEPNPSSGMDTMVSRHTYASLAEAEDHIARLRKFSNLAAR